jgi:hypothetical protein
MPAPSVELGRIARAVLLLALPRLKGEVDLIEERLFEWREVVV